MSADYPLWRVSVATLNRVLFPHPQDGTLMLALERKATVGGAGADNTRVRAQPFGGAVRILNPTRLRQLLGEITFDSQRTRSEQDFRILIPPAEWQAVKQYCLQHLENPDDADLEAVPQRELIEEFADALSLGLEPDQYTCQPGGFVIENDPAPTDNVHVPGQPTVRLYRIFEVHLLDESLCTAMLTNSRRYSDQDLARFALQDFQSGGRGCANAVLALPLSLIAGSYLARPPEMRFQAITIENHQQHVSVLAVLEDVAVPQYQWL
jgi:hypothetical protein